MAILKRLRNLIFPDTTSCDACRTKMQVIRKINKDNKERIQKMEEVVRSATMNGEEKWFLVYKKEDSSNGRKHIMPLS